MLACFEKTVLEIESNRTQIRPTVEQLEKWNPSVYAEQCLKTCPQSGWNKMNIFKKQKVRIRNFKARNTGMGYKCVIKNVC